MRHTTPRGMNSWTEAQTLSRNEGKKRAKAARSRARQRDRVEAEAVEADHNCWENAVPYESDGPLGHGWECGICGALIQVG